MKTISTSSAPSAIGPYSQAVIANGFIFASGQIPLNPATGTISETSIEEQTRRIVKNIAAVLDAAGSDLAHVVKTTCFLKNMSDFQAFNAVYAEYFVSRPARSCVEVSALPKNALIEIEIVALLRE